MFDERSADVPSRSTATRWVTRRADRCVLGVVHNVTSATRLFDILPVLAGDDRIQVIFSCTESSAFTAGTLEFLAERQVAVITWNQALCGRFDLAIAASYGGSLERLTCPLVILPHGMGYNKFLETGNRKPETGNRKPVFGLSPEWLLHDDALIPSSLVLSHHEQLDRLRRSCPAAVGSAVVAGDPCFDRMLASLPLRPAYRDALGVRGEQRLILVSSTWGQWSLFGRVPDLVRRLRAQLPLDEYEVALALHPNIWFGHSRWQVRMWLAECERMGVVVLPAEEGWRAGLVAADVVIGDHGSVTFYGAALGRPVLLATRPRDAVDPASAVGRFIEKAERLNTRRPLVGQIEDALRAGGGGAVGAIASLVSSAPGESARLLRAEFYRWLRLPEPDAEARTYALPVPTVPAPACTAQAVRAWLVDDDDGWGVKANLIRYPAQSLVDGCDPVMNAHLVVGTDEPREDLLEAAEIVVHPQPGDARAWIAGTFAALPGLALATMPVAPDRWLVGVRDGPVLGFDTAARDGPLWASVVHAWLDAGQDATRFPSRAEAIMGGQRRLATVCQVAR